MNIIQPQPGYQTKALTSPADILIGGGAAGVGKTFSLLMEPLRHLSKKGFGGVIFRRTSPMIRSEGALWDESVNLYTVITGARPIETRLKWEFEKDVTITFSHLEHEKNIYDWQGAQMPFIGFDELTHFSKKMFFYLLSRNRSTCGVKPYVRATCNPDPDHWLRDYLDWWIGEDGFPIEERQSVLRYFMQSQGNYIWGNSKKEVVDKAWHILEEQVEKSGIDPKDYIKSVTFIGGSIYDNKKLLEKNSEYLGNLNALPEDEKARLLHGNWNYKIEHNDIYDYLKFRDVFTNEYLKSDYANSKRYLTCDIAMKGSDNMVVLAWQGKMIIDFLVLPKTDGREVINAIKSTANTHRIQHSSIAFDNDGVGSFVDGFIVGAREFNNGARAMNNEGYKDLKSQCFFKSGDAVQRGEYYIPPEIANMPYDDRLTFKEQLMKERKAIKRAKPDYDGKLCVLPKHEMKVYLDGKSPDLMDAFMMREYFEIQPPAPKVTYY
jgi:hypothetical protein